MFPTKSDALINDVVRLVQGNLDAAIDYFLNEQNEIVLEEQGMSNKVGLKGYLKPGYGLN